jgi:hypothetical protein
MYYKKARPISRPHVREAVELEPKNASLSPASRLSYPKAWEIKNAKDSIGHALSLHARAVVRSCSQACRFQTMTNTLS